MNVVMQIAVSFRKPNYWVIAMERRLEFMFLFTLLSSLNLSTDAQQNCSTGLMNIVVYEGSSAVLPRSNNSLSIQWQVAPCNSQLYQPNRDIANYDDVITPDFTGIYAVNKSGLIILNAAVSPQGSAVYPTAGLYLLNFQNSNCNTGAGLTVVSRGPICSVDANERKLNCSIEFANYVQQHILPIMTWKDQSKKIVQTEKTTPESIDTNNMGLRRSTYQLSVAKSDSSVYECQVSFSAPTSAQPGIYASNAPDFTASCFISVTTTTVAAITSTTKKATLSTRMSTTVAPASYTSGTVSSTTVKSVSSATTTISYRNCSVDVLTNTVVFEGSISVAAFKRTINGQPVQWQITSSSDFFNATRNITNYDDKVVSSLISTYAVNQSHLIIINATISPQTAGLYVLNYLNPNCSTAANLIVIRSGPVCSCNGSDPANVKFTCMVDFAEASLQPNNPVFTWINGSSGEVKVEQPVPSQASTNMKRSTSQLTISSSDAQLYRCQLTFGSAPQSPLNYMTTTPPEFTACCYVTNCALPIQTTTTTANTRSAAATTTVPQTTTNIAYESIIIHPRFGPAAGGTVVTITANWINRNVSISAIYFGENLKATNYNISNQNILVKMPTIPNEKLINQQLQMFLEMSPCAFNLSTRTYFTYKPNPRIDDVRPREFVISGGIRLNITGGNFTSVAQSLVRAAVIIRNSNNTVVTYFNESFEPCYQPTEDGKQMICLSPPINIRDDFLHQLFGDINPYSNSGFNRKRRQVANGDQWRKEVDSSLILRSNCSKLAFISTNETYTCILENGQETMRIYLGMVFDGYERYWDDILRDSKGDFKLTQPPKISCKREIQFDPEKDVSITIQGSNMAECCREVNYVVRIGDGICNITSLTDNALTCTPPKVKPQQTENLYCRDNFAIVVNLDTLSFKCSCLKYTDGRMTDVIIIATTIGSFVVVIVVVIVAVLMIREKRIKKEPISTRQVNALNELNGYTDIMSYSRPPNGFLTNLTSGEYEDRIDHSMGEYWKTGQSPDVTTGLKNQSFRAEGGYLRPLESEFEDADGISYRDGVTGSEKIEDDRRIIVYQHFNRNTLCN